MKDSSRVLAVSLLVAVCGALGWMLTPGGDEARRESVQLPDESRSTPRADDAATPEPTPPRGEDLARSATSESQRSAATAERRTTPDQLELRQAIAAAEARHIEAVEAAFAALRESRGPGCIEGWRDSSGEVQLDLQAPPLPHLVRVYDLPADPSESALDPSGKGASAAPARVRVLAVHLTQANAPHLQALEAEVERLRKRLR